MRLSSFSYLVVLALGVFLITAGCTQTGTGDSPATPPNLETVQPQAYVSNETLVAFVDCAVAYAKAHGQEKALAEFNNPNGSFMQGELYIYAYSFNGTTLVHPVNRESVGKIRDGANGVFVTEMGAAVRNGSGFYRFTYINPLHNNTLESKLGYGAQVDENWWLGSGAYKGPVDQTR